MSLKFFMSAEVSQIRKEADVQRTVDKLVKRYPVRSISGASVFSMAT